MARLPVRVLGAALNVALALVLLFEEWGWRPLAQLMGEIARLRPIAQAEAWVAGLPPYGALVVFALPSALLAPLKLAALWLLGHGHVLTAGVLLAGAKIAGTALVARIFMLTRPALMRIWWFARLYAWFVPWKEALTARVRASWAWRWGRVVKHRLQKLARTAWAGLRPRLAAARAALVDRSRLAVAMARSWARRLRRRARSDPPGG